MRIRQAKIGFRVSGGKKRISLIKIGGRGNKARDVLSLLPLAATEVKKEYHVPCHCPKSNIVYFICLIRFFNKIPNNVCGSKSKIKLKLFPGWSWPLGPPCCARPPRPPSRRPASSAPPPASSSPPPAAAPALPASLPASWKRQKRQLQGQRAP